MKVVSLDLDGTLIHPAIFNVVADALGFGAPLRVSYAAYVAGTMTLEAAYRHDFPFFVGRSVDECRRVLRETKAWTPGIRKGIEAMRGAGLTVILTTDQPEFLARAAVDLGVQDLVCSPCRLHAGRVTEDLDLRLDKWANLQAWLAANGVEPSEVTHVGNGANDIPVFQRVGYSIAVNPSSAAVSNAADDVVDPLLDLRQVADLVLARRGALR